MMFGDLLHSPFDILIVPVAMILLFAVILIRMYVPRKPLIGKMRTTKADRNGIRFGWIEAGPAFESGPGAMLCMSDLPECIEDGGVLVDRSPAPESSRQEVRAPLRRRREQLGDCDLGLGRGRKYGWQRGDGG
jgi:hypothetical protein